MLSAILPKIPMKHLVKKYIRNQKLDNSVVDILNNTPVNENEIRKIVNSNLEEYIGFGLTGDNEMVQTFKFVKDNMVFLIPEPDPIVIYFDSAVHYHNQIIERKSKLFESLSANTHNIYAVNGDFYWYFSLTSSFIVFLFLSIEAFTNKIIPYDFEYKKVVPNKRTEIYNKLEIQRNIDFIEKLKFVIPQITKKNFVQEFSHKFQMIKNLKEFRDDIVHTKSKENELNPNNFYEELFKKTLDFDFTNTLLATKDFINYYQKNLIEECNCGYEK
jgi:hypothetical protein